MTATLRRRPDRSSRSCATVIGRRSCLRRSSGPFRKPLSPMRRRAGAARQQKAAQRQSTQKNHARSHRSGRVALPRFRMQNEGDMRSPMSEIGGPVDDGGIAAARDPFELFSAWLKDAEKTEPNEANAMAVATVDAKASQHPHGASSRSQPRLFHQLRHQGGLLPIRPRWRVGRRCGRCACAGWCGERRGSNLPRANVQASAARPVEGLGPRKDCSMR
jgi:hypothetical protein